MTTFLMRLKAFKKVYIQQLHIVRRFQNTCSYVKFSKLRETSANSH